MYSFLMLSVVGNSYGTVQNLAIPSLHRKAVYGLTLVIKTYNLKSNLVLSINNGKARYT